MAYNNQLEGYTHPIYSELHECRMNKVQGPASATDFAHFRSRNIVILRAVHAVIRSAASAAGGSLHFTRSGVTLFSKTIVSATSAGSLFTITLTSSNTLHTITEVGALRVTGAADKGKWDVLWEYDVVYPATKIGS